MSSTTRMPPYLIETINKLVRASRQMLQEHGREPTAEELARRLAMPLEAVRRAMAIAGLPITYEMASGG